MTRTFGWSLAVAIALASSVTTARGQTPAGVVLRSGATEINLNGRVQAQFNTTDADGEPATQWELRRVRLEATVRVNDLVSGKVQPEFAGSRVSLRDAWVRLSFDPGLLVTAGQMHRQFGVITPTSALRILPIERGVRIRGVGEALDYWNLVSGLGYADRDVGIQLSGEPAGAPLGLAYALGYFNGPARDAAGGESTDQLVARLSVRPLPKLRIGAGWSGRHFVTDTLPGGEADEVGRGHAWGADVEWGEYGPGLHLVGEVATGDL
ncbi:MAG TPA: porin, partial [Longimicrobiaceae bacterium]|nr:porin [Longimicrobiaceae bacterium]